MSISNNYKQYKKSFSEFIRYYNENSKNLDLSQDTKDAIKFLHCLWKNISAESTLDSFFEMKKYHSIINSSILWKECITYKTYISQGLRFRTCWMENQHNK